MFSNYFIIWDDYDKIFGQELYKEEVENMAKKTTRNSKLLYNAKAKTSSKIYSLLVDLVNDDREDLAEVVLKIDYLLEYSSSCIKQRDFDEAKDALDKTRSRIDMLKEEGTDTEYLDYLYEGIKSKAKC